MLCVALPNVAMLSVALLHVLMLNVAKFNFIMLNVVKRNVIMLSVVAPCQAMGKSQNHLVDSFNRQSFSLFSSKESSGNFFHRQR
jgi:hypothetical protein